MVRMGLVGAALLASSAVAAPGRTAVPPTIAQLMDHLGFKASLASPMLSGQVLSTGMPEMEQEKNELAVSAVMLVVRRPIEVVVDAYMDGTVFRLDPEVEAFEAIEADLAGPALAAEFDELAYRANERSECQKLMRFRGGEQFNLSVDEIERMKALSARGDAIVPTVNETWRSIVRARYEAYRGQGLEGIEPYQRSGRKRSSPRKELTVATSSMTLLRDHFAGVYDAILTYPEGPKERAAPAHRFFWIRQNYDNRPNFVLSHHVADIRHDYAIVVEQQFYVANTYNSQEAVLGCVPYEGGTVVFFTNRTFTDQITGFAAGLAQSIGRQRVERAVAGHFTKLRAELENR